MRIIKLSHPQSCNNSVKNDMYKRPSLVKVYHPNCIHCRNLEPNWNKMIGLLKKRYNCNMNVIDAHANVLPMMSPTLSQQVNGYPSIFEVSKNGTKMDSYEGNRTSQDLLDWVSKTFKKHGIKKKYITLTSKNGKKGKKGKKIIKIKKGKTSKKGKKSKINKK